MKKKEPTIAEILHYAADYCLYDNYWESIYEEYQDHKYNNCFDAVWKAAEVLSEKPGSILTVVAQGMKNLGFSNNNYWNFSGADINAIYIFEQIQQQRYAWLEFCALLAEEQQV